MVRRICCALVLTWFCNGQPSSARNAQDVRELTSGVSVDGELASGSSDTFRLALTAGDFLHLTIVQRGYVVAATLSRPDGTEVLSVSTAGDTFGDEALAAIADTPGRYTLVLRRLAATEVSGRYSLTVDALRPATPPDRVWIEAETALARGVTEKRSGQAAYSRAVDEFVAALARYREVADRRGELRALLEVAGAQTDLSQPDALATAQLAERLARDLGNEPARALALSFIGRSLERAGDLTAALRTYGEALSINRALGHRGQQSIVLNNQAILYARTGDPEQAVARFEESLALARASGRRLGELGVLGNLGVAYKNLGEWDRALDIYGQALAQYRERNDPEGQARVLNNMGNVEHQLGRDRRALELHQEALTLSRQGGGKENEARSLNTIGQTYFALGEYTKALDYNRESLEIRRATADLPGQGASLDSEGRAWHRLGEHDKALAALNEALTIRRNIREQSGEMNTLRNLAALERDRGHLSVARGHIAAAVDLEETLRERITSPALRTSFVATQQDKYELFVDILQAEHAADPSAGYAAMALHVNERARARVLLDSLLDAHVDLREGIDTALLDRERVLQKQLNDSSAQLSRLLAGKHTNQQTAAAARKLDDLTRDYQELQAEIRRRSPRYAAVMQPQPLEAAGIQSSVLDSDTVLLEIALGEERSWLWAVTPETISSTELPPRRTIDAAARSLYERFVARQKHSGDGAVEYAGRVAAADAQLGREAARVSQMLFGGIADRLNGDWRGKRLVIVTEGTLEYLPFAALPIPDSGGAKERVPLITRHEIVTTPSATILAVLRREIVARQPARKAIAILADPVFESTDPRVRAKPAAGERAAAFPGSPVARPPHVRAGLVRLPFSRGEAETIALLAPAGDVYKVTDFKASREAATDGTLADYRLVHFATHGVVDAERPALSGLVLSLVDEQGAPRNGYLRLHDIYNMRLNADLVVLSGCDTALGKEIKGEGLIGLTRAFMYAGAPRIVASLWQVSDLATAELMKRFYAGMLQRHLPPAAALRAAQLAMAADPRWSAPYYWAGFVMQGDWQ
jgi:CHAT domain-containing protein/Tfp pilus assembly protein PilF